MDFEAILQRPFRWPQAGDRLFTASPQWDANAYVSSHGQGRMALMMMGYKRAADLMVEQATADRADRDTLVFPIIFNYRQYLELSLKFLIATYGDAAGVEPVWSSHDLTHLWTRLEAVLDGNGARQSDGVDAEVAAVVAEFATVDPRSIAYRYPVDTKGQAIVLPHEHLDLAGLADVMQGVDGYFSGCDGYLDALRSGGP